MHGRTPVRFRRKSGFSFAEILIVILIMALVMGVVGSLMAGYVRMFNETDDQSVAKRRATDVFNILNVPIINAGLGIPVTDMGWYFAWPTGVNPENVVVNAPPANWLAPVDIRRSSSYTSAATDGDILNVVYSTPTGWKSRRLVELEPWDGTIVNEPTPPYSTMIKLAKDYLEFNVNAAPASATEVDFGVANSAACFYTVPDAFSNPLYLETYDAGANRALFYARPRFYSISTDIPIAIGEVSPFSDVHKIQAMTVYVDSNAVFHAAEITDTDIAPLVAANPGSPAALDPVGMRVEGVKAIRFVRDSSFKTLTVHVLCEGEIIDPARNDDSKTRTALRTRWSTVTDWDDRIYYEDYAMTWRTRSIVPAN